MIEKADKKDVEEINKIISKEFSYKNVTQQTLHQRLEMPGVIILKKMFRKKIAGFIDFEVKENTGFINAVSVKTVFRKKGFGKELINFALDVLKQNNVMQAKLLVKQDNVAAKKLYNSAGFLFQKYHEKKIDNSLVEIWEKNLFEDEMEYLN